MPAHLDLPCQLAMHFIYQNHYFISSNSTFFDCIDLLYWGIYYLFLGRSNTKASKLALSILVCLCSIVFAFGPSVELATSSKVIAVDFSLNESQHDFWHYLFLAYLPLLEYQVWATKIKHLKNDGLLCHCFGKFCRCLILVAY